jgi:hypothetical protein
MMKTLPINSETPFILQLAFCEIIENLEKVALSNAGERSWHAKELLQELAPYPEFKEGITDLSILEDKEDLLHRLLADYFPPLLTYNEIKGVGIPFGNLIINPTGRLQNILKAAGSNFNLSIQALDEHQLYVLTCCLILNEVYKTQLDFSKPMFYSIPTAEGIIRHYRILHNGDFLHIYPTEKAIALTQADIDQLVNNFDDLALWKAKFPAESWLLKGFAIFSLVDTTVETAVSIFKDHLLDFDSPDFQQSITSIFRSIYRLPDIQIGYTVYSQEENTFKITSLAQRMNSFILPDEQDRKDKELLCVNSYRNLIQEKTCFTVPDTAAFYAEHPDSKLASYFLEQNIHSFILAPVVKNNVLMGLLEIASPQSKVLNSVTANKLDIVMPFLAVKMERLMVDLQNQIQAFIQDKFTTIHTSVNWKFRNEAKKHLSNQQLGKELELEEIVFQDVYPLYGQVDVKGSSEARNLSVQKDLQKQLEALDLVLQTLQQHLGTHCFQQERQEVKQFLAQVALPLQASQEQYISTYLTHQIHPRISELDNPELLQLLSNYFSENEQDSGAFHTYRRKYEKTISTINEKLASILDTRQETAQLAFPHYYERFKTDGVDHNLYIGASIAPQKPFSLLKLHQLRLWQLRVLCEMEMSHHQLIPSLPYPLEVTSLILVYHTMLAIRFRMDEKRFDVDGSYNARFEIVKKRIDKAHIKNTDERITVPGKITIVYSSEAEEVEYRQYMRQLQVENILAETLESFEVEDLQGVSGLKALRATFVRKDKTGS